MQDELSPLIGLTDTVWRKKDNGRVDSNVNSRGSHYRDYVTFGYCNVSYPRERSDSSDNVILIGHVSICPYCGEEINGYGTGTISHSDCIVPTPSEYITLNADEWVCSGSTTSSTVTISYSTTGETYVRR